MALNPDSESGRARSIRDRVLSVILAMAILGAIATLVYLMAVPGAGESFTEFYLLDADGETRDYPDSLRVGEEGKVITGIINREDETVTYWVRVRIDGIVTGELGPLTLEHDEEWQGTMGFTLSRAGEKQPVEFLLYRQGQAEPYQELYLWVDIR